MRLQRRALVQASARRTRGMSMQKIPAAAVWGLGLTQIIGYGTIFYSFSILAPAMATRPGWPEQWIFGALSVSLLISGLLAPTAGRLADRYGAARAMSIGSIAAALSLLAVRRAPGPIGFAVALIAMQIATCFIFYSTAFVVIVQLGDRSARAQHHAFDADRRLRVDAVLADHHLAARRAVVARSLCPVRPFERGALPSDPSWLTRLPRTDTKPRHGAFAGDRHRGRATRCSTSAPAGNWSLLLMLAGFAVEGLVLSAILDSHGAVDDHARARHRRPDRWHSVRSGAGRKPVHQHAVRRPAAATLACSHCRIAAASRPAGPAGHQPLGAGAIAFRHPVRPRLRPDQHRRRHACPWSCSAGKATAAGLGWVAAARQFTSALAPFALSWMIARTGPVDDAFVAWSLSAAAGVIAFAAIVVRLPKIRKAPVGDAHPARAPA